MSSESIIIVLLMFLIIMVFGFGWAALIGIDEIQNILRLMDVAC